MNLKNKSLLSHTTKLLKAFFWLCIYSGLLTGFVSCKDQDAHEGHYEDLTKDENLDSLLGELNESTNRIVISAQPTVKVAMNETSGPISFTGIIQFDERRTNAVSARVNGRIEELYVRYNFQYVKKGQAILSLYSPELITYMEQYIMLFKAGDNKMLKLTAEKLQLLGLTRAHIRQIEQQGKPLQKIIFYSPIEGFIRFGSSTQTASSTPAQTPGASGMGGMGDASANSGSISSSSNAASELQPGMYVQQGQTLFSTNDLKQVWASFSVPTESLPLLEIGIEVKIKVEGVENELNGIIDFIEPAFDPESKFGRVRVYLPNPKNNVKFNALATAEILPTRKKGLFLPSTSVYSLGRQHIVWLKTGISNNQNVFEVQQVSTGSEFNGMIEILSGLEAGNEVAANAAYLVDSEGLIILNQ